MLLAILKKILDYLNENDKIEVSRLNEMLLDYEKALEKELKIEKWHLDILEKINQLIKNQNDNEIVQKLKKLLKESLISDDLVSYAKNYNEAEHGNIKQLNAGLGTTKELI